MKNENTDPAGKVFTSLKNSEPKTYSIIPRVVFENQSKLSDAFGVSEERVQEMQDIYMKLLNSEDITTISEAIEEASKMLNLTHINELTVFLYFVGSYHSLKQSQAMFLKSLFE